MSEIIFSEEPTIKDEEISDQKSYMLLNDTPHLFENRVEREQNNVQIFNNVTHIICGGFFMLLTFLIGVYILLSVSPVFFNSLDQTSDWNTATYDVTDATEKMSDVLTSLFPSLFMFCIAAGILLGLTR